MNSFSQFKAWWSTRSESDRVYLILLTVLLFLTGTYSLLYLPLADEHERALQRYERAHSDYFWAAERLADLGKAKLHLGGSLPVDAAPGQLKEMLEDVLKKDVLEARLGIIQTDSGNQIKIEFKQVNGQKVMRFIEHIVKKGFSVLSFKLENSVRGLSGYISVKA